MRTAKLITDMLPNFNGHAAHYRLSEPHGKDWDEDFKPVFDVVVSTASVFGHVETYIFPADETGRVTHWGEMTGSIKGTDSHEEVLREAGYEIV